MAGTTDLVWRGEDTTPAKVDEALRKLIVDVHQANEAYVPARVLNLVCIVDKEWSGEVANRLRKVGRYHPSRTVVCAVSPKRTTIDAAATVATPSEAAKGGGATIARETVILDVGPKHLPHLDRIVDPLVVTDLATVVWAPHGHDEGVDALAPVSQVVLIDSVDADEPHEAVRRAREIAADRYVVDLAWLRSTPWRERIAGTFDPDRVRPDLKLISRVAIKHHPESVVAAAMLVGWLGSRLGWDVSRLGSGSGGGLRGTAHTRKQDVAIELVPDPAQDVRGLRSVELESASGRWLRFDRGPGGLRVHYKHARGTEREWTIMGASRGESGILGEGIRQALLRDPTYAPALDAAGTLLGV